MIWFFVLLLSITNTMAHPEPNTIILCGEFYYIYLGSCGSPDTYRVPNALGASIMYCSVDDPEAYMAVRAVYPKAGKYYFVPSSFSDIGNLSTQRKWSVVEHISYPIKTLSRKECQRICPGYLDEEF